MNEDLQEAMKAEIYAAQCDSAGVQELCRRYPKLIAHFKRCKEQWLTEARRLRRRAEIANA